MNKREFYKRLMSEYTFDSDKVRRVAKRSSIRMLSPERARTAAAVAAGLAVTVGVISLSAYFNRANNIPSDPNATVAPAKTDRLVTAEKKLRKYSDSIEVKTMYLSFGEALSYTKLRNTIDYVSDTGKIQVEALYVLDADDNVVTVTDPDEIEIIKNDDEAKIIGAKVAAPANLGESLISQPEVVLAEIEPENINEQLFVPLLADPGINDYVTPEVTTPSQSSSGNDSQTDETSTGEEVTVTGAPPDTSVSETSTGAATESSAASESETTDTSEEPKTTAANGVPQERFIELSLPGVTDAEFISDKTFAAITKESVGVFSIKDSKDLTVDCEVSYDVVNCRKRYSASGNSFLISGCDGTKLRTLLFLANAKTGTLEKIDISAVLGDPKDKNELMFAFYDDVNDRIIARVSGKGYNTFYLLDRSANRTTEILRSKDDAAVLAVTDSALYYSLTKTAQKSTSVCKLNLATGIAEELYIFAGSVNFDRSDNLKNFSVNTDADKTSRVFVVETDNLTIPVNVTNSLVFRDFSDTVLSDGDKNYVLVLGELVEPAAIAITEVPKRAGSALFTVAEIGGDKLKIKVQDK